MARLTRVAFGAAAASQTALRTSDTQAAVIRIRDGKRWTVTSRERCSLWCIDPIAVGCHELYAEVYGPQWVMTRIPLAFD